jgi:hypothetical protein
MGRYAGKLVLEVSVQKRHNNVAQSVRGVFRPVPLSLSFRKAALLYL